VRYFHRPVRRGVEKELVFVAHDFFFFRLGAGNFFNSLTAASKSFSTYDGSANCAQ